MKRILQLLGQTAIEAICFLPVLVLVGHFFMVGQFAETLFLLACGSAVGFGLGALRLKIYLEWFITLGITVFAVFFSFGITPGSITAAVLLWVVMWRGTRAFHGSWRALFPLPVHLFSLCGYLLFPIFAHLDPGFDDYSGLLFALGFFSVAAFFFRMNRSMLSRANLSERPGSRIPAAVARTNRLALTIMLIVLLGVTQIRTIKAWLIRLWEGIVAWVHEWLSSRKPPEPIDEPPPSPVPDGLDLLVEDVKPRSELWHLIQEIVMNVIVGAVLIGLAIFLLYAVVKYGIPALRRWLTVINQKRQEESAAYIDETEMLVVPQWGKKLRSVIRKLAARREPIPTEGRARVRYYFKEMLRTAGQDGYKHEVSRTPLETARELDRIGWRKRPADLLTRLYNQVRYGGKDLNETELRELEARLKEKR